MTSKEALDNIVIGFNDTITGMNGLGEIVVDNSLIRYYKKELDCIQQDLDRLENLEKQLGCPLEVIFKAFNDGFYDIDGNHFHCEHYVPYLKQMHTRGITTHTEKRFNLKDYKITWWLKDTREE